MIWWGKVLGLYKALLSFSLHSLSISVPLMTEDDHWVGFGGGPGSNDDVDEDTVGGPTLQNIMINDIVK